MKKIFYSFLTAILLLSNNVFAETTTISTEFEKKVTEESVSFLEKENRLIDLYINFMFSTGKTDYISFLKYTNLYPELEAEFISETNGLKLDELNEAQINTIFSNSIFNTFNNEKRITIDMKNLNIVVKNSVNNDSSFAAETYLSYALDENINYTFENSYSSRIINLSNEMIDMIEKLGNLLKDGAKIVPYEKINDLDYITSTIGVTQGELFYVAKLDYTVDVFLLDTSNDIKYMGNVTNFDGVILDYVNDLNYDVQNFSNFIPKVIGSVGYLLKYENGTALIEEYIFDGEIWKPKFESLNTELNMLNSISKLGSIDDVASSTLSSDNNDFVQSSYDNQYLHGTRFNHYNSYGYETNLSKDPLYGSSTYNTDSHFTYPTYSVNEQLSSSKIIRDLPAIKTLDLNPPYVVNIGECCWVSANADPSKCERYRYTCDFGGTFNRTTGNCDFPPVCPNGFYLSGTQCLENITVDNNDKIDIIDTVTKNRQNTIGKYDVGFATEVSTYTSTLDASIFYFEVFSDPIRKTYQATGSGTSYSCKSGDTKLWNSSDIVDYGSGAYLRITPMCKEANLSCPSGYSLDTYNNATTCTRTEKTCAAIKTKYGTIINSILARNIKTYVYNYTDHNVSSNVTYVTSGGVCSTVTKKVTLNNKYYVEPYVEINYSWHGEDYGINQEDNSLFRDFAIYKQSNNELLTSGTNQDVIDGLNTNSYIGIKDTNITKTSNANIIGGNLVFDENNYKKRLKSTVNDVFTFEDMIIDLNQVNPAKEIDISE